MFEPHPATFGEGAFSYANRPGNFLFHKTICYPASFFKTLCHVFGLFYHMKQSEDFHFLCFKLWFYVFLYFISAVSHIKSFRIYKLWRVNGNWIFDYKAESSNDINKMSFLKIFLCAVHNSEILQHYLIIWRPS